MCKAKKPKTIEIPDPVFMRNPILDGGPRQDSAGIGRRGRTSLRIPMGSGLGIRSENVGSDTGLTYDPVPVPKSNKKSNRTLIGKIAMGGQSRMRT